MTNDSEFGQNEPQNDSTPCSTAPRKAPWGLALLVLVLGVGGWMFYDRQRFAAEEVAREELKQLGALVIMDANQKHVQGVNLTLPGVREKLDSAIPLLSKLTYLEVLTLTNTSVTDQQMSHVASCRNLTSLVLTNTELGDAALAHFTGLRQLRTLYLGHTKITTQGLEQIGKLTSLSILDLSGTALEGDLASLLPLSSLQHLLLSEVELSDAMVETIGQLPSLSRLSVQGSDLSNISDSAIEKLKQAKPELKFDGVP